MTNLKKSSKVFRISPSAAQAALGIVISFVIVLGVACKKSTFNVTTGSGTWANNTPLSVGMAEVGVAELDGKIYAVGGTEQEGSAPPNWASTLNMMYDPAQNTWQKQAPLPHLLSHAGVAAMDGKLYAIGGFTTPVHIGPQNLAFVYDPKTNQWSALPEISSPRGSVAAAAVGGKLHIFGGRISNIVDTLPPSPGFPELLSGFGTVNMHEIYDPTTGKWSQSSPIPGPARDHMGIAVLDGKIHLFGGRTADVADNLDRHDVYDPQTDQWTIAAPLPRPRSSGAYTVLRGLIIYAGGECKPDGQVYDDVTAYTEKTNSWTTLKPLPQAHHAFGAATVGDVAYFAGGALLCGGGTSTDMLSLTIH